MGSNKGVQEPVFAHKACQDLPNAAVQEENNTYKVGEKDIFE